MKRCPFCGAKNKDSFDFCVRCSEALDEVAVGRSVLSRVLPFVVLILMAVAFLGVWQYLKPKPDEAPAAPAPPPPAVATAPDIPPAPPIDIERANNAARMGIVALHDGQYEKAAELFEQFVQEAPNNPYGHMYLALAHYALDETDQAIDAMGHAFDLAPGNPGFGHHLVGMLMQKEDFPAAEEVVRRYLEVEPDDQNARIELVRLMRRQGGLEDAIAEGQRLVADAPENLEAVLELGTCLKDSGKLEEAGKLFQRAVELDPKSPAAQHAWGVSQTLSGDYKNALAPLRSAVEMDPDNGLYRLSLAQTYEKLDQIEQSFEQYEAFLKYSPDDPRAEEIEKSLERAKKTWKQIQAQKKQSKQDPNRIGEYP
jgi:tetratricopeptide (TPR) repeat protein